MIFDMMLVAIFLVCYVLLCVEISKQANEIDDLRTKHFILKEKTRDLENRISFLEMFREAEKARTALPRSGKRNL